MKDVNKDFEIPCGLSRKGRQAAIMIRERVLEKMKDTTGGGGRAFYTPQEWRDRGEDYGCESLLIVCHEGGSMAGFFNYDYQEYDKIEGMSEMLLKYGVYAEQCTGWYTAIYPIC
ncbi:MAG: hypothetical protein NUW00_04845 [Candidatus Kaiserbacteria bacterium]|nr:hypothetical protein [Candidatus Kaiserbacteria bacterium]MCR4330905.1 hypothetical protein [Patescibacteria group bacterium]